MSTTPMGQLLKGKVAIITGANQGLGLEIARHYIEAGASVSICARDETLLARAKSALSAKLAKDQKILAQVADVSRADHVDFLVAETLRSFGQIDILVNNAGVYGPKGAVEDVRWEEWTRAIEINVYGSVLMSRAVLPHFKARKRGKVIQLSGGGATSPLPKLSAYAVSKAAIVRFVDTLAEEVKDHGIDVNAIAPGPLNTRLLDEILEAGAERVGASFYERALEQKEKGGAPPEKGARLAVFLASDLSDGITGKLISAIWDPWESLPRHLDELRNSDIYSLRRIVPGDRGKTWGDLG